MERRNGRPTPFDQAVRVDNTTTANVIYIGKAAVGSATSGAVWQMKKIDKTSGVVVTFADGNSNYDNIWDNRATTVVYS